MKITYLLLLSLFIFSLRCEERFRIYFSNQTNKNVEVFILHKKAVKLALPDKKPNTDSFGPNKTWILVDSYLPLDQYFSQFKQNTIHVYVLDKDTIDFYPWQIIKNQNKIITRYDVKQSDLKIVNNVETIIHTD